MTAPTGSAVAVEAITSKPVATATVIVLARGDRGDEVVADRLPMALAPDRRTATARFDLPARATAYRVEVIDDHGFANRNPPRRGLTVAPDEPPRGELLDEVMREPTDDGPLDNSVVTGMPVVVGGQIQVGYRVRSPLGVARTYLVYRVNDGPWHSLPLAWAEADPARVGAFRPDLGVFERTPLHDQVEFYSLPSPEPGREPPGLTAGGRVNFQTAALTKPSASGRPASLEPGDRVEYFVAAYDRNPLPAAPPEPNPGTTARQPWRSESRVKTVVTAAGLWAWLDQRDQTRRRLRELEDAQRRVFAAPDPEGP